MSQQALDNLLADLRLLCAPGLLGFYEHFDVIEIVGMRKGLPNPFNVLTVLVAEERSAPIESGFMGDRISVPGLEDIKFGIHRCILPLQTVTSAVEQAAQGKPWALGGGPLRFSKLSRIPPMLAPPDGRHTVPLNAILKNNFWDGSYVLELFDETKDLVSDLLVSPPRLMALAEAITEQLPIRIAGLSDRLGNVIVQMPVDIFRSRSRHRPDGLELEVAWHPRATPRQLEAHACAQRDRLVTGHTIAPLTDDKAFLPVENVSDPYSVNIWDPHNRLLLSASGERIRVQQMALNMGITGPAERVVSFPDGRQERVPIRHAQPPTTLGAPREHLRWTTDRLYAEEASSLAQSRRFRQYSAAGPESTGPATAIKDLRYLIERYGQHGVWLWDPYLSAEDILQTLLFNPHAGAPMRGLASAPRASGLDRQKNLDWMAAQRATLSNSSGSYDELNLEYRALHENSGWDFHDRFLIFRCDAHD